MKKGFIFKQIISLFTIIAVIICSLSAVAKADTSSIKVLFIGNSITYYNDMGPTLLYNLGIAAGKNIEVDSVTESSTTMYRCASTDTSIGQSVDEALSAKSYDFVIIQPSRRVTPVENTVYEAEKAGCIALNERINKMGAKTLIFSTPGVNSGYISVYQMNENGLSSANIGTYNISRQDSCTFTRKVCNEYAAEMTNASVVYVGDVVEEALYENKDGSIPFYISDGKHPTTYASYLYACSFYSAIFGAAPVGNGFVYDFTAQNALYLQRITDIVIFNNYTSIIDKEKYTRKINTINLTAKNTVYLKWDEGVTVHGYQIYRKIYGGSYSLLASVANGTTEYTDNTISTAGKYYYKVRAIFVVGDLKFYSTFTTVASIKTLGDTALSSLKLKSNNSATIQYKQAYGATGYRIYRKVEGGTYSRIATTTNLSYTDKTLKSSKTYFYKVKAYTVSNNKTIYSLATKEESVSNLTSPAVKLKVSKTVIRVSYNSVKNAQGYKIYIKKGANGSYKLASKSVTNSVIISNLKRKSNYYIKVKAYRKVGSEVNYSIYSNVLNTKTK